MSTTRLTPTVAAHSTSATVQSPFFSLTLFCRHLSRTKTFMSAAGGTRPRNSFGFSDATLRTATFPSTSMGRQYPHCVFGAAPLCVGSPAATTAVFVMTLPIKLLLFFPPSRCVELNLCLFFSPPFPFFPSQQPFALHSSPLPLPSSCHVSNASRGVRTARNSRMGAPPDPSPLRGLLSVPVAASQEAGAIGSYHHDHRTTPLPFLPGCPRFFSTRAPDVAVPPSPV